MKETVNNPDHYLCGGLEVIDIIASFGMEGDFSAGNVLKYFLRAPFKGSEEEDYRKAQWYLDRIDNRDPAAWHFLCHDRIHASPVMLATEKVRLHWYEPLSQNSEIQLHHVIDAFQLTDLREEFMINFHYKCMRTGKCLRILDELIDACADYDKVLEDMENDREL